MATASASTHDEPAPSDQRRRVLTKAVLNAARLMQISQAQVALTLGLSAPTVSRMASGAYLLDPGRKEWEFGSLFVRVFRSLDSIVGSEEQARAWLHSRNAAFDAKPADLLPTAEGLVRVLHYLDNARGRI